MIRLNDAEIDQDVNQGVAARHSWQGSLTRAVKVERLRQTIESFHGRTLLIKLSVGLGLMVDAPATLPGSMFILRTV